MEVVIVIAIIIGRLDRPDSNGDNKRPASQPARCFAPHFELLVSVESFG